MRCLAFINLISRRCGEIRRWNDGCHVLRNRNNSAAEINMTHPYRGKRIWRRIGATSSSQAGKRVSVIVSTTSRAEALPTKYGGASAADDAGGGACAFLVIEFLVLMDGLSGRSSSWIDYSVWEGEPVIDSFHFLIIVLQKCRRSFSFYFRLFYKPWKMVSSIRCGSGYDRALDIIKGYVDVIVYTKAFSKEHRQKSKPHSFAT